MLTPYETFVEWFNRGVLEDYLMKDLTPPEGYNPKRVLPEDIKNVFYIGSTFLSKGKTIYNGIVVDLDKTDPWVVLDVWVNSYLKHPQSFKEGKHVAYSRTHRTPQEAAMFGACLDKSNRQYVGVEEWDTAKYKIEFDAINGLVKIFDYSKGDTAEYNILKNVAVPFEEFIARYEAGEFKDI